MSKKDKVKILVDFLNSKPGYGKEGASRFKDIVAARLGMIVSYKEALKALKIHRGSIKNQNLSENNTKSNMDVNSNDKEYEEHLDRIGLTKDEVKSVKYWQTSKGEMRYSVVAKQKKTDLDNDAILERFKNFTLESPPTALIDDKSEGAVGVTVIADLHIGAYVRRMMLTPDYDIDVINQKLWTIANRIREQNNSENHLFILGDLIESFTGLNHKNSWKQLELHGVDALIAAYQILSSFITTIPNLKGVYIVGGNHDRVTSDNKEDTSASGAKLVAYMLQQIYGDVIHFSPTVISQEIDGINYVATHGHLGLSRKNIESLLYNYAPKNNNYTVALSGHLHTRGKTVGVSDTIINDSGSYRGYICPSIFTGNDYSEKEGFTTTSGFLHFTNVSGLPEVIDIPIK